MHRCSPGLNIITETIYTCVCIKDYYKKYWNLYCEKEKNYFRRKMFSSTPAALPRKMPIKAATKHCNTLIVSLGFFAFVTMSCDERAAVMVSSFTIIAVSCCMCCVRVTWTSVLSAVSLYMYSILAIFSTELRRIVS